MSLSWIESVASEFALNSQSKLCSYEKQTASASELCGYNFCKI